MKKFLNSIKQAFLPNEAKDLTKIVKDCEARIFDAYVGNEKIDPENIAFVANALHDRIKKRLAEVKDKQKFELNKTRIALEYLETKK